MTERNTILVEQEMAKRARIKKEFLAHADDFYNEKYSIQKLENGNTLAYILTRLTKDKWSFKIMPDDIQQLSGGPTSSSDYWAHAFMQDWMMFPMKHGRKK